MFDNFLFKIFGEVVNIMNRNKTVRLSTLFEKMVADSASVEESYELKVLYQEYINDGRDNYINVASTYKSEQQQLIR